MSISSTPFLSSEWRGQNRLLSDIPSHIRTLIRSEINPPNIQQSLLPRLRSSVLDFISAELPDACKDTEQALYLADIPPNHFFFSIEAAVADTNILKTILVPPKGLVAKLLAELPQKWLDGNNSIHLFHQDADVFLPLWALKFWSDLHLTVLPVHKFWTRGIEWLKRSQFQPFCKLVLTALKALDTLVWSGSITSGPFNSPQLPKSILPVYLSRAWLSGDHIDQILQSLDRKITQSLPNSRKIHFIDTILAQNLRRTYLDDESGKILYDPKDQGLLSRFGAKLSLESEVTGSFHINGNHWIAVVVNIAKQEILYGDPARLNLDLVLETHPLPIGNILVWTYLRESLGSSRRFWRTYAFGDFGVMTKPIKRVLNPRRAESAFVFHVLKP
ncbi:hypothetical protein CPB83DRAFT_899950 [Crepidotus variabilis]|uniref:Ubiquitin-like protease family profile domain-containing protein n=1 Tax=Crepidotus variabilis TaxID=179855 RepID=A0A9P6E408_9AGAR|nr:hypothetical protein CPB83DRAFT_899950 [Crepidotus variabilis]